MRTSSGPAPPMPVSPSSARSSGICGYPPSRAPRLLGLGGPGHGSAHDFRDATLALRLAAIQHRARAPFVQPLAGDRFYVRLLCEAGDLAAVRCHFADKYAAGVEGTLSLSRETTDGVSDYWSAVLPVPTSRLRYFFELT